MIQRIAKDADIKFCVSDDAKIHDKFIIRFYTVDKTKAIVRTADNVIVENGKRYIKLNWTTLKYLDNGILNYEVNNLDSDADYNDGVYNSTFTRTTYYYLYTDSNGIEDGDSELTLKINELSDRLNEEIARAQTAETENTAKIGNEITNRESADQYIRDLLKTETSERKKADTTLTATTTNLDTRLKNLENQEYQTVWDFGTY